jgi:tetratricopeptide (TPR) repeat protein
VTALNSVALAHGQAGQVDRAIGYLEVALELRSRQGDRHREAALHNNLADLLHADGRREEAMAHLKHAVAIFAEVGEPGTLEPEIWKLVAW